MHRTIGNVQKEEEGEVDLTPMLDVVFIMLIFFIVTATFVKEIGIDVTSPDKNQNVKDAGDHDSCHGLRQAGRRLQRLNRSHLIQLI